MGLVYDLRRDDYSIGNIYLSSFCYTYSAYILLLEVWEVGTALRAHGKNGGPATCLMR